MGAPADAIRELLQTIEDHHIISVSAQLKDDISQLRRAFPDDVHFATALRAVSRQLRSLDVARPSQLDHELTGWDRVAFPSTLSNRADLRIIFRRAKDGIEVRAFGHRHDPESVYFRAAQR